MSGAPPLLTSSFTCFGTPFSPFSYEVSSHILGVGMKAWENVAVLYAFSFFIHSSCFLSVIFMNATMAAQASADRSVVPISQSSADASSLTLYMPVPCSSSVCPTQTRTSL